MPHFIVEYTDNIQDDADVSTLLKKAHDIIIGQEGSIFPPGATRSRAIVLTDYRMADGEDDYAFVHVTLKIGAGRTEAQKTKVCDELFAMMKVHFAGLFARRYLALSMELHEFDEGGTYKYNNVHARFSEVAGSTSPA